MEVIGIIGTLVILLAFVMNGEVKIRLFDLLGAVLFIIYGITISSFSTILLNVALVIVQLFKLNKLRKESIHEN